MAMKAMIPLLVCMFVVASAAVYDPNASSPAPLPGHSANCGPPPPPPPPCNGTTTHPPTTTPSTPPPTTTPSSPPTTTPSSPPTTTPSTPPPTTTPSASPPSYPGAPTASGAEVSRVCAQSSIPYCDKFYAGRKRFCQKITSRCCHKYKCLPGIDKSNCPEWGYVEYHGRREICP